MRGAVGPDAVAALLVGHQEQDVGAVFALLRGCGRCCGAGRAETEEVAAVSAGMKSTPIHKAHVFWGSNGL